MKKSTPITKLKNFWKLFGPGLITGASDDDPSGIATYSQAGSRLWTLDLMHSNYFLSLNGSSANVCQNGMVTSYGLTGSLKKHYPRLFYI